MTKRQDTPMFTRKVDAYIDALVAEHEVFTHTFGAHLAALPPEAGRGLVDIDDKTSGYPHVHS